MSFNKLLITCTSLVGITFSAMASANALKITIDDLDATAALRILNSTGVEHVENYITAGQVIPYVRQKSGNYTIEVMYGTPFNCNVAGNGGGATPILEGETEVILDITVSSRICKIVDDTTPPPGPEPTLLNVELYNKGTGTLYVEEYDSEGKRYNTHIDHIAHDNTDEIAEIEPKELGEQFKYAMIKMEEGLNTYTCVFPEDNNPKIENMDTVHVIYDNNRSTGTPPCFLYKAPVEESMNTTFSLDLTDIPGVRLEYFNVIDKEHQKNDFYVVDEESVNFSRPRFTEYSYIMINQINDTKLDEDIPCLFDNDSEHPEKIFASVNELKVHVTEIEDGHACRLSQ